MIYIGLVHDKFCLMLYNRKALGWGTFPKCGAGLGSCLDLAPLFLECHTLGLYPTHSSFSTLLYPLKSVLNVSGLTLNSPTQDPFRDIHGYNVSSK